MMARFLARLLGVGNSQLRRRWDRTERMVKAAAVAAALLAVVVAVATGVATDQATMQTADEKVSTGYQTLAVLQEDAVQAYGPGGPGGSILLPEVPVLASWRTPDGRQHEGQVLVDVELTAGAEVPVWVDSDGKLMSAPKTRGESMAGAVVTGLWNLALMELVILAGYWIVMWVVDQVRLVFWGREWARVEPSWSRRRR